MRRQIAAANWKMNLTSGQGEQLLDELLHSGINLKNHQLALFAVPFPYLAMTIKKISEANNFFASSQNCHHKKSGAYTGEVSAEMLRSIGIGWCVIGHSERREYFHENNQMIANKLDLCLENGIQPIFCCGESLDIREAGTQNSFVETQLKESLFHLNSEQLRQVVIAYEPIWAIGTGKTATTDQAQEMHAYLRSVLSSHYGSETANSISILYGGSVKAGNAAEIFNCTDVDGGLVGGASLVAADFIKIIQSLK